MAGWIGVDLDGTLAHFDRWRGPRHIGLPIPAMAKRVHDWHARGIEVRIFTARASRPELIPDVQVWLNRHGFPPLAITNQKDFGMVELWDDRAIQVLYNTGKAVRPSRLQDVERAKPFDPDEIFADAEETDQKSTPSAEEIESFKRNIRASSDNSVHSLDDLLDALDDGEYSPGSAPDLTTNDTQLEPSDPAPAPTPAAQTSNSTTAEPLNDFIDLPIDATGFVTPEMDNLPKPKNAVVELDLGGEELDVDLSKDDTLELDVFEPKKKAKPPFAAKNAKQRAPAESIKPKKGNRLDATLDDQPQATLPNSFDDLDNLNMALDPSTDLDNESIAASLSTHDDTQIPRTNDSIPTLNAFSEDELDDLDDLPAFKVDRR